MIFLEIMGVPYAAAGFLPGRLIQMRCQCWCQHYFMPLTPLVTGIVYSHIKLAESSNEPLNLFAIILICTLPV